MGIEELRERCRSGDATIEDLRALARAIHEQMQGIDTAAGEGDLTDEQQTRWSALQEEHSTVTGRADAEERRTRVNEERARLRSIQLGTRVEPFDGRDVMALRSREVRDKALAVLDREEHVGHLDSATRDGVLEQVSRLIRANNADVNGAHIAQRLLLTENDDYRMGFLKAVTRANPVLTSEQARAIERFDEWRGMVIGTDASGGFGVPVLIDPTIILTAQGHPNDILGLARVETITNDEWKGVTSAGVTWKFRAEAATTTDGSPTLAQPTVPTHRADGVIKYSIEVGMDYPGFASEMETLLREGYSELLVQKLTVGSGTNEPTGIVTALDANTNVEVATTTAGVLGSVDVNKLWKNLPIRYRNPALSEQTAWMTHTGINGLIQQLGQDAGSSFTVNFTDEGVVVLKGRRAYENDYMADMPSGTTAGNLAIVGAWRNFLVAQRAGMNIELVQHVLDVTTNMPTGERMWFAWARVGSDSINDLAFRLLQNKTS
ncbi:MAG TPA: phage major capsid protein [Jiangellaceae bacterium]|nr:phage major capsid protein [Jiangellaceae bacterium]